MMPHRSLSVSLRALPRERMRHAAIAPLLAVCLLMLLGSAPAQAAGRRGLWLSSPTMAMRVVNTRDRTWPFKWNVRMNVVNPAHPLTQPLQLTNTLDVEANCADCRAIGVTVQLNVISVAAGPVSLVANSTASSTCTDHSCLAMGMVVQYTLFTTDVNAAQRHVVRLMNRVIARLRTMFPNSQVSMPRVLTGFNSLLNLFQQQVPPVTPTTPSQSNTTVGPQGPPSVVATLGQ